MTIQLPDPNSLSFSALPADARQEVRDWLDAFASNPVTKPIGQSLHRIARHIGRPYGTVRRKYDEYRKTESWKVFIPKHKLPKSALHIRTKNQAFRNHLATLAENHQRNSKAAIRKLKRQWKNREHIPAYEDFSGHPSFPDGWSDRNLARIIQEECDARALQSLRHGTSSKTNYLLPQVHLTRVGLYPGAVYQIDDVWHDHFVTIGRDPQPVRVLELGVMDLFSGCRFHWGTKPRTRRNDGTHQNLNEREMRLFLAATLLEHGYSARGTQLMVEHGTAAIRDDVERILHDDTGGLVSVVRQPIEGGQQALNNYWPGSEGGNFRAKASLESLHNLIHNDLSDLALQTGKNKESRPVITDRQLHYISKIIKDVSKVNPAAVEALQLPGMDFHSQFVPFLNDYYRYGLNARTDHNLQGWKELGHLVTEYTMLPGSDHFLSAEQFLALPEISRLTLAQAAQNDPKKYSRKRYLSPNEVWLPAVSSLLKIAPHTLCDILSQDLAREIKVEGSYIDFNDQEITAEKLIYSSRLHTIDGATRELPSGQTFSAFANPFAPRWLFICDAKGTCLGFCELVKRPSYTDTAAIQTAAAHKRERIADILQPSRQRQEQRVGETQALKLHNNRLKKGESIDPQERRSQAGRKASATRRENRVHHHAEILNQDDDTQLAESILSSPTNQHLSSDSTPDDDDEFENPFT